MAKEDLLPYKYDAKTNTVFNTSGVKIADAKSSKPKSKTWFNTFFDNAARYSIEKDVVDTL
jgi:hypothetical protein